MNAKPDRRLLKIDVGDGNAPVALQYGIGPLPHIKIYEGEKLAVEGDAALVRLGLLPPEALTPPGTDPGKAEPTGTAPGTSTAPP